MKTKDPVGWFGIDSGLRDLTPTKTEAIALLRAALIVENAHAELVKALGDGHYDLEDSLCEVGPQLRRLAEAGQRRAGRHLHDGRYPRPGARVHGLGLGQHRNTRSSQWTLRRQHAVRSDAARDSDAVLRAVPLAAGKAVPRRDGAGRHGRSAGAEDRTRPAGRPPERRIAREAAEEAEAEGLEPIPAKEAADYIERTGRSNIPFLGDYVPEGWVHCEQIEDLFVDSLGLGSESEPALTLKGFVRELRKFAKARDGYAFGIREVGQFQVYVRVYKPDPRDFTRSSKLTEKELKRIR